MAKPPPPPAHGPASPLSRLLLAATALVALLAVTASMVTFQQARSAARDTLGAVAELRVTQIEAWLAGRIGLLRLTGSSRALADQFTAWRDGKDVDALRSLLARLEDIRDTVDGDAVWLLDTDGRVVVLPGQAAPAVSAELQQVARKAMTTGELQHTGIYRPDADRPPVRLVRLLKT